jgi:hypothetical protein
MANWQATLLNAVLTSGSVLVFSRDRLDEVEEPTVRTGDTFYGSVPDGDPFGGTFIEVRSGHAVVEVNQQRHHMHRAQHHEAHDDVTIGRPHESWIIG